MLKRRCARQRVDARSCPPSRCRRSTAASMRGVDVVRGHSAAPAVATARVRPAGERARGARQSPAARPGRAGQIDHAIAKARAAPRNSTLDAAGCSRKPTQSSGPVGLEAHRDHALRGEQRARLRVPAGHRVPAARRRRQVHDELAAPVGVDSLHAPAGAGLPQLPQAFDVAAQVAGTGCSRYVHARAM